MKKRKIEKIIFNLLMCTPLLLVLVLYCLNFSGLWSTGTIDTASSVLTKFNEIMANFTLNSNFTTPIKYLMNTIFSLNATISESIASYIVWLVLIELIHLLYDILILIPRMIRNMLDKGLGD